MAEISSICNYFIGGSADLASATGTYLEGQKDITAEDYTGKNILFGVREQAMGAILNGISTYHYHVFGSTFLSFSFSIVRSKYDCSPVRFLSYSYLNKNAPYAS